MTLQQTGDRIEHDIVKAAFPAWKDAAPLYFVDPDQAFQGWMWGYDYHRPAAVQSHPPFAPTPAIDSARDQCAIGFQTDIGGADDRFVHERGHALEEWAWRCGVPGYEPHTTPTTYLSGAFQEKFWRLLGLPGTYLENLNGPSMTAHSNELFAEAFAVALTGCATVYPLPAIPRGDAALIAFFNELTLFTLPTPTPPPPAPDPLPPPPPPAPSIVDLPSPNFSAGRSRDIRYIVVHTTEGIDSRGVLTTPRGDASVSAHYLIRGDTIYRLVDEWDTAWHAGIIVGTPTTPLYDGVLLGYGVNGQAIWSVNPNDESIGIEVEGYASQDLPAEQPDAWYSLTWLIEHIRARNGELPLVGHFELSPGNRSDPGAANLAALKAEVDGGDNVTDEEFLEKTTRLITPTIDSMKATYNPLVPIVEKIVNGEPVQQAEIDEIKARLDKLKTI